PIGNWILQQAFRMAEKWIRENNYKGIICINISAIQLRQPGFVDWVKRALTDTGIDPGKVELEITESIFIDFFDAAAEKLGQLQKLGVRISLDDFGTGYSSLAYLKTLPIQTLKIDRAFINEIKEDSSETKMLSSIIALVRNMDMETVAEGVETKEQFNYLRKSGCDIIQGYLASRPVREGDVPELIGRDVEGRGFNGIEL
ncbi:MAG: EAL domain-containing protein, partial [Clostridiales bacterium]|nr:EAL domain-containing protein [Clostridiales bacterium]